MRSMDVFSADWQGICRRIVAEQRAQVIARVAELHEEHGGFRVRSLALAG